MKFILSFMAGSVFKCQNSSQQQQYGCGEMSGGKKEKCHKENFLKRKRKKKFSVTKLLCCHVDGEKLCVPHFPNSRQELREDKNFLSFWTIYWFIIKNWKWDEEQSFLRCLCGFENFMLSMQIYFRFFAAVDFWEIWSFLFRYLGLGNVGNFWMEIRKIIWIYVMSRIYVEKTLSY